MRSRLCWQISKCWTIEHWCVTDALRWDQCPLTRTVTVTRWGIRCERPPPQQPQVQILKQTIYFIITVSTKRGDNEIGTRDMAEKIYPAVINALKSRYFRSHLTEVAREDFERTTYYTSPEDWTASKWHKSQLSAGNVKMLISFYCIVKPREAVSISVARRPPGLRHPGTCLLTRRRQTLAINGLQSLARMHITRMPRRDIYTDWRLVLPGDSATAKLDITFLRTNFALQVAGCVHWKQCN